MENDIKLFGNLGLTELLFTALCAYGAFAKKYFISESMIAWIVIGLVALGLFGGFINGSNPIDNIVDVEAPVLGSTAAQSIIFPAVVGLCMFMILQNCSKVSNIKDKTGSYIAIAENKMWWYIAGGFSFLTAMKSDKMF